MKSKNKIKFCNCGFPKRIEDSWEIWDDFDTDPNCPVHSNKTTLLKKKK